ncbi:hypothetical protein AAC387_Pa04g2645 [Persea americana]
MLFLAFLSPSLFITPPFGTPVIFHLHTMLLYHLPKHIQDQIKRQREREEREESLSLAQTLSCSHSSCGGACSFLLE